MLFLGGYIKKESRRAGLFRTHRSCCLLGDDAGHFANLVAVTPLIVVPCANLNEGGIELDTSLDVEDGGAGIVAEIGADDSLVGVAENALEFAFAGFLHGSADLVIGSGLGQFAGQVDERYIAGGNAERHAGELAVENGENLTYGLGCASAAGDDVLEDTTATAPILLRRTIDGLLGSGCSVYGGHEAAYDTELVVEDLADGSKAVGGAACVADDGLASIGLVVDTIDEHRSGILAGSGHDDLLGTSLEVCLSEFCGEEETSGLNNNVNAKGAPGDVDGILLGEDLNLVAVDDHVVALDLNVVVELAVYAVILQHVSQIVGIEKVVDTYDNDVLTKILNCCTENHTSDAAETINTKFNHFFT